MNLTDLLAAIQHSWLYWLAIIYFAAYPMVTSVMWITTAMFFRNRWEQTGEPRPLAHHPSVSILIPAHNEERVIANALEAATAVDYPDFEVVVVDDGSSDQTWQVIRASRRECRVVGVRLSRNHGHQRLAAVTNDNHTQCLHPQLRSIAEE